MVETDEELQEAIKILEKQRDTINLILEVIADTKQLYMKQLDLIHQAVQNR